MTVFIQNFTTEESGGLFRATSFEEAKEVAISQMRRLKNEWGTSLEMVFGPMTSGGLGCEKENRALFKRAVVTLRQAGYPIFCQTPYEKKLRQIKLQNNRKMRDGYLYDDLLRYFYKPIIRSGYLVRGHYVPNWHTSTGSQIEQAELIIGGIPRSFLGPDLLPKSLHYLAL